MSASALPADAEAAPSALRVVSLSKLYPVLRRGIFRSRRVGTIRAVDDISFTVPQGGTLGLVGESGCGKTTTARSILHLVQPSSGQVRLGDQDLIETFRHGDRAQVLAVRRRIQYVFQDPYLSLNPRWTIAQTLAEPLRVHNLLPKSRWLERVTELLELVGLEPEHAWRYPHEFSGGQRQRVGIARALAVDPAVLICDEPVSSLDVSVRAQILNLLVDLQGRLGLSYLYISHDLGSVRFISSRIAVMYLGQIVEIADTNEFFDHPRHHYSHALLQAVPVPNPEAAVHALLQGEVPSAISMPSGCRFHPRCPAATALCADEAPPLRPYGDDQGGNHLVACHHPRAVTGAHPS